MSKIVFFPRPQEDRVDCFSAASAPQQIVFAETADVAIEEIKDAAAFVGKLTPELLNAARHLRWVQAPTASLEHFIFPELIEHPCTLTNVAGIFGDVIAEHVLGYVLSFTRNLHHYRDRQQHADYRPVGAPALTPDFVVGPSSISPVDTAHSRICDSVFLVVGMGGIGREIARTLLRFNARVDGVDPVVTDRSETGIGQIYTPEELPSQIDAYDFVVIAAPHTPQTEGWFDAELLRRMKTGAILINVGRGAIVKLDALASALQSGHLGGAALDVFETEPLPHDSPLWTMPNVLLTPHVAACCDMIAPRQQDIIADNLRRFALGQPLQNHVDKANWF